MIAIIRKNATTKAMATFRTAKREHFRVHGGGAHEELGGVETGMAGAEAPYALFISLTSPPAALPLVRPTACGGLGF